MDEQKYTNLKKEDGTMSATARNFVYEVKAKDSKKNS